MVIIAFCVSMISLGVPTVSQAEEILDRSSFNSEMAYRSYLLVKLEDLQRQLELLLELREQLEDDRSDSRSRSSRLQPNPNLMQVSTRAPISIQHNTVELSGFVDRGSAKSAEVWFQYGKGNSLNKNTSSEIMTNLRKASYTEEAFDLEPGTKYSYRVVIEDEDGYRQYGEVRSFTTPSAATTVSFTGRPFVETGGVINIGTGSGEIKGFVSMNDYEEGVLFFTYGLDSGRVKDAEDYDTYEEIPIERGVYGKTVVEDEFRGRDIVKLRIWNLNPATKYYYNVCVEYRDGGRKIRCGDAESFVTLN